LFDATERLKATITATGQFNHPGDPMSVIIGRGGIPAGEFKRSAQAKALVDFLSAMPWVGWETIC